MTVPAAHSSPRRLVEQSSLSAGGEPPRHQDPLVLRQLVQTIVQETLHQEFAHFLGAARYERAATRTGVRNGTRPRTLVTRVGRLVLAVPRDRAGCFAPSIFPRYQRHEQALLLTLTECYLQGVSTRKVRHVVEMLAGESVSASLVSAATKRLDASLAAWRMRRLDGQPFLYLIVDAHYERIRRESQVLNTAVLWVVGVRADGYREHLGCWLGPSESAASWNRVFRELLARGLRGVRYVVSDDHQGLGAAIQRYCPEAVHQRCQVHYVRDVLAKVTHPTHRETLLAGLRDVWAAPTPDEAERRGAALSATLRATLPAVADYLDDTLGDTLGFYVLPEAEARRRLRTTNALEREHEEVRRRTRVIRIFPNEASYLRLVSALTIDRNDAWAKRRYVIPAAPLTVVTATRVKRPRRRAA